MDIMLQVMSAMLILLLGSVQGQFETRPENIAVIKGNMAVLQCTVTGAGTINAQQNWYEYYTDPITQNIVAQNNVVRPAYFAEFNIQGVFNLQLNQSQLKHGGKYGCSDTFAAGVPYSYAELIVLDSDPVMTSSGLDKNIVLEGNSVKYTCEVTFQGRWRPVMEWTDKDNNKIQHNDENTAGLTKTNIMFDAKVEDNGQQYKCNTKFGPLTPAPGTDEANNIPGYTNTNISDTLIVHYGPRNTQIKDPNGNVITDGQQLYLGETITCSSTSNPPIDSYQWINATDNSTLGSASSITVDQSWMGENEIRCRVGNTMGANSNTNEYESTEVFMVTIYTTTLPPTTTTTTTPTPSDGGSGTTIPGSTRADPSLGNPPALGAGAIAGIVVALIIIIIAVIVIVCCCMRKNTKEKDVESTRPPKSALQADHVRQADQVRPNMYPTNSLEKHPDIATIDRNGPPPYNSDYSYDSQDPSYGTDPRQRNVENIVYADLALDDTPRSRKPIQVYEPTDYAEIKRV